MPARMGGRAQWSAVAVASVIAVVGGGCSVESKTLRPPVPDGGNVAEAKFSPGIPITPNANGFYDGTNAAGVLGAWWATGDDYGPGNVRGIGSCTSAGFAEADCSSIVTPVPGQAFRPDAAGRGMCTSGTAAMVLPDASGNLAYGAIWGNSIAFDLNHPGGTPPNDAGIYPDAGAATTPPSQYDALAHGVTGIAFDISTPPPNVIRVGFETFGTEGSPAYWEGATATESPITGSGTAHIHWSDVGGPIFETDPPPFDPTKLEAIIFQVTTNPGEATSYSYCVNNIVMLTN